MGSLHSRLIVTNAEHHVRVFSLHRRCIRGKLIRFPDRVFGTREIPLGAVVAGQSHPRRNRLRIMFTRPLPKLFCLIGVVVLDRQRCQALQSSGVKFVACQHVVQMLPSSALVFVLDGQAGQVDACRMEVWIFSQCLLVGGPRRGFIITNF